MTPEYRDKTGRQVGAFFFAAGAIYCLLWLCLAETVGGTQRSVVVGFVGFGAAMSIAGIAIWMGAQ